MESRPVRVAPETREQFTEGKFQRGDRSIYALHERRPVLLLHPVLPGQVGSDVHRSTGVGTFSHIQGTQQVVPEEIDVRKDFLSLRSSHPA